jgi:hypothetical protein
MPSRRRSGRRQHSAPQPGSRECAGSGLGRHPNAADPHRGGVGGSRSDPRGFPRDGHPGPLGTRRGGACDSTCGAPIRCCRARRRILACTCPADTWLPGERAWVGPSRAACAPQGGRHDPTRPFGQTGALVEPELVDVERLRRKAGIVALVVAAMLAVAGYGWWKSSKTGREVPDTLGVGRRFDGLHILDAYFVRAARPETITLTCDLITTSGDGDRLMAVSAGGGSASDRVLANPGTARPAGLPLDSAHLLQIGPEPDAHLVTISGHRWPAGRGRASRHPRDAPAAPLLGRWPGRPGSRLSRR